MQNGLRKAITCKVALAISVEVSIMTARYGVRCFREWWRFTIRSIEGLDSSLHVVTRVSNFEPRWKPPLFVILSLQHSSQASSRHAR